MRFFTSDQHYGHNRIAELANRPFAHGAEGVPTMNEELIRHYCDMVDQDDEVWFAGDFAMGMIAFTLPFIEGLPGSQKTLVYGNHDRCSPAYWHILEDETLSQDTSRSRARMYDWRARYLAAGFTAVKPAAVQVIANTPVMISHYPYKGGGDSQQEERFTQYRPEDDGHWLICGHVHDTWRQKGRMINVGVDAWGGYPVSEDQIAVLIEAGPQDRPVLPWA